VPRQLSLCWGDARLGKLIVACGCCSGQFIGQGAHRRSGPSMGDITYIAIDEGWMFLAVVIDLFRRQVVC
jgi:hypothetical protein